MKTTGLVVAAILAMASFATAQDSERIDVSISAAGVFSKRLTSNDGSIIMNPTASGAVIGSVGYHFTQKHEVEVNIGHTSNSQVFTVPPDNFRVVTGVTEFTAAYVFRPFASKKWEPFLLAGGGGLRFSPNNTFIDQFPATFGATSQTALAFLYGGGVDHPVWRSLAVRLQYRGLLYKNPDFGVSQLLFTGARGHMAEPSAGLVFKF